MGANEGPKWALSSNFATVVTTVVSMVTFGCAAPSALIGSRPKTRPKTMSTTKHLTYEDVRARIRRPSFPLRGRDYVVSL